MAQAKLGPYSFHVIGGLEITESSAGSHLIVLEGLKHKEAPLSIAFVANELSPHN